MPRIVTTAVFDRWIEGLRDRVGRARILRRIVRFQEGNPGTLASVGGGVSEMKVDGGPASRICFVRRDDGTSVILLCGGDKGSQARDVVRARELALTV